MTGLGDDRRKYFALVLTAAGVGWLLLTGLCGGALALMTGGAAMTSVFVSALFGVAILVLGLALGRRNDVHD